MSITSSQLHHKLRREGPNIETCGYVIVARCGYVCTHTIPTVQYGWGLLQSIRVMARQEEEVFKALVLHHCETTRSELTIFIVSVVMSSLYTSKSVLHFCGEYLHITHSPTYLVSCSLSPCHSHIAHPYTHSLSLSHTTTKYL